MLNIKEKDTSYFVPSLRCDTLFSGKNKQVCSVVLMNLFLDVSSKILEYIPLENIVFAKKI